jgi:hypothetical protein
MSYLNLLTPALAVPQMIRFADGEALDVDYIDYH